MYDTIRHKIRHPNWRTRDVRLKCWRRHIALFLVAVVSSVALVACSNNAEKKTADDRVEITLASYAGTRAAYEEIIPQFVARWKVEHDRDLNVRQKYGGSGSQVRAVIDGLEADVVALSLKPDIRALQKAGLIEPGWETEAPNNAIVHRSAVALATRDGDPTTVGGWEDLARDDIQIITPGPKLSGEGRWNFLALWGAITRGGGSEAEALTYLKQVYSRVPVLASNTREATRAFYLQEIGDVAIDYESEVRLARQQGKNLSYTIPETNISIENPVAVVDANVAKHGTRDVAEAFLQFLYTPAAQREFAKAGLRPVNDTVVAEFNDEYPDIPNLFTVEDLGGWDAVQTKFFGDGGVFETIQAELRGS